MNKTRTKLTGALCGLGYDKTLKMNLCAEYDIENIFDVYFSREDIVRVNAIRSGINMMIGDEKRAEAWMNDVSKLKFLQDNNYNLMKALITTNRESALPEPCGSEYKWNQVLFSTKSYNSNINYFSLFESSMKISWKTLILLKICYTRFTRL